ncbi:MAG: ABC transporter ATP-binding protein [Candidatus Promineifilaceae bacterium]
MSTRRGGPRLGYGGGVITGESATSARETIGRLISYARPYRGKLLLISLLIMVGTLASLAGPILFGRAVDEAITPGDVALLAQIVLLMLVIYLAGGLAAIIYGVMMVDVGQRLVADIRAELFTQFQALSLAYHDRHQVGDLMSRVSNDSEAINQVLSNGLIQFMTNVLTLGGIMVAMFLLNWQLAIGTLIILPLMLYITSLVTRRSRVAFREVQQNLAAMNTVMEETINGLRVVQAFARSSGALAQFEQANAANRQSGTRADVITAALGPMFITMSTITVAVTALLGGWLALRGVVTVGVIATFVVYINNFFRPLRGIAMLYNQLQSALAGAERIFAVLDAKPEVVDAPGARPLSTVRGDVVFENVTFGYDPDKPVLRDVSLAAKAGQTIALVGPTGAGKTTVISLLSRFYDVQEGRIMVDGRDIREVTQDSLRSSLGIVLQDTFLFADTVMNNIRYGRLSATDEEVIAAAKLANADWFIRRLPQGYETLVSEKGHNFSQGQRQLLAIARAVLADPRILILDEATSSVDTRTEQQIQQGLLRLMEGRTAFVIAHRLSTIRQADQLLVIDDGRIIERGTHDSLLAAGGFYSQLYRRQYGDLQERQAEPSASATRHK